LKNIASLTPYGLVLTNEQTGVTTFDVDGVTGDVTATGTIAAESISSDSTSVFLDGLNLDVHTYDEGGAGPPSNTTLNAAFPTASIGDKHTMRDANNTSALYEVQKTTSTTWRYWASTACP
jgi:hypothetical protein